MTPIRHLALLLALAAATAAPAIEAAPAAARSAPGASASASAAAAAATPPAAPAAEATVRKLTLAALAGTPVIRLRTISGLSNLGFGVRRDEIVTKAVLKLQYAHSPSLLAEQSHLKLLLNDEFIVTLPLPRESGGRKQSATIDIDPRLLSDFNRLSLQFIAHYTNECEDPLHNSLWADISGASTLELTVQPLPIKDDLARLPGPFFDAADSARVRLPFVFGAAPDHATLRAAAISASWFGQIAAWRGARFPVRLDRPGPGHAVVVATNQARPAFLREMAPVTGPTLAIMTNPVDQVSKLLLVLGRDGEDLRIASTALALGHSALSGPAMLLERGAPAKPRQAYDAPNWVRLDRPTKFGELTDSRTALAGFGHEPLPLLVNLRVPPDLFTWRSRGVPVDLKYRYSPPIRMAESRLSMMVNGELVQAFNLRTAGQGGDTNRVRLPLLDNGLLGDSQEVLVPSFKLGSRNELRFDFAFAYQKEGNCKDTMVENVRSMIDADSTIDFSGFPHYAEMPHLGAFATAGFPFTKYADLSQTAVVMPEPFGEKDVEAMLTLMGRMGESTGYPATGVQVTGPRDWERLRNLDLLLIGSAPEQGLLTRWAGQLPANIAGQRRTISQPTRSAGTLYDWFGFGSDPVPDVASVQNMTGNGPLAVLLGFESPLTRQRSVVALTAVRSADLELALEALDKPDQVRSMHGSAVFFREGQTSSVLAGAVYKVGSIPFWTMIWFPLSGHPVLMAVLAMLAIIVFGFALWRSLKAVARRRVPEGEA
jgi:hypothetical protein